MCAADNVGGVGGGNDLTSANPTGTPKAGDAAGKVSEPAVTTSGTLPGVAIEDGLEKKKEERGFWGFAKSALDYVTGGEEKITPEVAALKEAATPPKEEAPTEIEFGLKSQEGKGTNTTDVNLSVPAEVSRTEFPSLVREKKITPVLDGQAERILEQASPEIAERDESLKRAVQEIRNGKFDPANPEHRFVVAKMGELAPGESLKAATKRLKNKDDVLTASLGKYVTEVKVTPENVDTMDGLTAQQRAQAKQRFADGSGTTGLLVKVIDPKKIPEGGEPYYRYTAERPGEEVKINVPESFMTITTEDGVSPTGNISNAGVHGLTEIRTQGNWAQSMRDVAGDPKTAEIILSRLDLKNPSVQEALKSRLPKEKASLVDALAKMDGGALSAVVQTDQGREIFTQLVGEASNYQPEKLIEVMLGNMPNITPSEKQVLLRKFGFEV